MLHRPRQKSKLSRDKLKKIKIIHDFVEKLGSAVTKM